MVLQSTGTAHMDSSDLGVLGAATPSERETKEQFVMAVRSYARAFFDRFHLGLKVPILDAGRRDKLVEAVQRFPSATRSR